MLSESVLSVTLRSKRNFVVPIIYTCQKLKFLAIYVVTFYKTVKNSHDNDRWHENRNGPERQAKMKLRKLMIQSKNIFPEKIMSNWKLKMMRKSGPKFVVLRILEPIVLWLDDVWNTCLNLKIVFQAKKWCQKSEKQW